MPTSPFIEPSRLLFWPKSASLPVHSALSFYLKLESKVQIYIQNASLLTVTPYILNNLVMQQTWINHCIMKNTSFNHKTLTPNQYSDTFWVLNELIVHNLHFRTRFCGNKVVKICGWDCQNLWKYTKIPFIWQSIRNLPQIIDIFWKVNFFCTYMVKIVFKMQIYSVHQLLNCSCMYWRIRSIFNSKIRPINHKILVLYIFRLNIEVIPRQAMNFSNWK